MNEKLVFKKMDGMITYSDEENILMMKGSTGLYFNIGGEHVYLSGLWYRPNYYTSPLTYDIRNGGKFINSRVDLFFDNFADIFWYGYYSVDLNEVIERLPFTKDPKVTVNGKEVSADTVEFYRSKKAVFFRMKNSKFVSDNAIKDAKKKDIPLIALVSSEFFYSPTVELEKFCKLYIGYPFIGYEGCYNDNGKECSRFIFRNIPIVRYTVGLGERYNLYYSSGLDKIVIRAFRLSKKVNADETARMDGYIGTIRSMFSLVDSEVSGGTI